ncbi:MAG TPA: hypothetical protein VEI83_02765 [Acidimicrobiales bacterium]|nr:hypothetical protein [Acidimicrobiales bacterium]
MKAAAWVLALLALAGLIVLSVAGLSGALAILLTAVVLVAMVALGSLLGGRKTPDRAPKALPGPGAPTPGDTDTRDEGAGKPTP